MSRLGEITFAWLSQELVSLVPCHVNVLALAVTATHKTLQVVCERLSLRDVAK